MRAIWNNKIIAESDRTIVVENNRYFPPDSVKMEYLKKSGNQYTCRWKGVCDYYDVVVNGEANKDAAWVYPEPTEAWNTKTAPPLFNAAYEAQDGARRLLTNLEMGMVYRSSQVQRIMKSALAEARRARRHTFVLPPSAWVLASTSPSCPGRATRGGERPRRGARAPAASGSDDCA